MIKKVLKFVFLIFMFFGILFSIRDSSPPAKSLFSPREVYLTAEYLQHLWQQGDHQRQWQSKLSLCLYGKKWHELPVALRPHRETLRGNPLFLQCLLKEFAGTLDIPVDLKHQEIKRVLLKELENGEFADLNLSNMGIRSVRVVLVSGEEIWLNQNPQRTDFLIPHQESGAETKVSVDRYLVSTFQFKWVVLGILSQDSSESLQVAKVSPKEMSKYCRLRGGHILGGMHYLWLAAKSNWDNRTQKKLYKDQIATKETCFKIFTKECFSITPYQVIDPEYLSFIGLSQIFGGPPELLIDNREGSDHFKIKLSSYYYPLSAIYHAPGMLGSAVFNTQSGDIESLEINGDHFSEDDFRDWKVGFRCQYL